jgi:response regulator RpfG family c-di-GMP phosphodiesterase
MRTRILFVDDDEAILRAIGRVFRNNPYEIFSAPSAEAALEQLDHLAPMIVVSDYRMPGMDGVTFLRAVSRRRPDSVRILLTGYADVATAQEAINDAAVFRFLTKPWREDELHSVIQYAVEEHETRTRIVSEHSEQREILAMLKQQNAALTKRLEESALNAEAKRMMARLQLAATARSLLTALFARYPRMQLYTNRSVYIAMRLLELAGEGHLRDSGMLAGWLHDIGYLSLNINFTADMRPSGGVEEHCRNGSNLLQVANFNPIISEAVLNHHENWDGTGPRGLRGTEIPLISRCLRLADHLAGAVAGYKATEEPPVEAIIATVDSALNHVIDPRLGTLAIGELVGHGVRSLLPVKTPVLPEFEVDTIG